MKKTKGKGEPKGKGEAKGKGEKGKLAVKREAVKSLTDEQLDEVSGGLMLNNPLPGPKLNLTMFNCGPMPGPGPEPSPFPIGGGGISRPSANPTGSDGCCGG